MSNFMRRDDSYNNRLSSFLAKNGELKVSSIKPIKKNVYQINTLKDKWLILKIHRNREVVEQQWQFFDNIRDPLIASFQKFPNGNKLLSDRGVHCTITPFIRGTKLNYKNEADRIEVVNTIQRFHKKATTIYVSKPIKKDLFYRRWYKRLLLFMKTEHIFHEYGYIHLYEDIVQTTKIYLQLIARFSWENYQSQAEKNGTWIHGDVASHNFIKSEHVYMIDFDLLSQTSQLYDFIQLGQRFLPYLDWNLDALLSYQMVSGKEVKRWLVAIAVPSDFLREWLHFLHNQPSSSFQHYLSKLDAEWSKRQIFLKKLKLVLKS
ncbi:hypothetical protein ACFQ3N_09395 [Virgibacillus byunsanensis]|uniref:Aminoglycoside phosphotransferase domain-containing protein n=1 Tax=Virgibacillus byunsanensis TaxID=570945 RepID=A0ABW3LMP7_9BACI